MSSNQLSVVTVNRIPNTKESEVPMIYPIPNEKVDLYQGYYPGANVLLQSQREYYVNIK